MILFIFAAMLTGGAMLFFFYEDMKCENTQVPENLSASATVQKYFEYWNSGNNTGMKLLNAENTDGGSADKNYIPSVDLFCDISCSSCELLDEKAENYDSYADSAIVRTDFTYKRSFGFGDKSIPSQANDWEFHLVKESESSDWKIISVEKS